MELIMKYLGDLGAFLWGAWTPWVLLATGVLFTVWTKFTQAKAMTHGFAVVRGLYDDPKDPGAINHFQALSAALSATVGLGNIGGVALAIGIGGPGALVWMWIVGFFGMALKTVEITLAMMYRNTDDPENPRGGAMWVVENLLSAKGGHWKTTGRIIGVFFCITLIISTFTGGNMFQAWSVAQLTQGYFGVPPLATGIAIAVIVGAVIIGGIKRIGVVAGTLVPFMCLMYLIACLSVLALYLSDIPGLFALIFQSAFSPTEATGAFIGGGVGFAFMEGMKRALFSNEAGQGSAPIAHAAAKTNEPAREGVVGGLGPFIDTLCICTLTALVILSTGTWNRSAIGEIKVAVVIEQAANATAQWNVVSSTDIENLPQPKLEAWKAGDAFFLVAEAKGSTHIDSGRTRLHVMGKIIESEDQGEGDSLKIEWGEIKIDDAWSGPPASISLVDRGVWHSYDGALLTGHAFDRAFPGLGKWLVTFAAWLFAISTMISWCYYGEQGMVYMVGPKGVLPYKLAYLLAAIYAAACITNTDDMLIFMDIGTGAMLWANIPIVVLLGHHAVSCESNYFKRLAAGEFKRRDKNSTDA